MTTLRTFIAIHTSTEAQIALNTLQQRLKVVLPQNCLRWTIPKDMHLTLHFLGEVQQTDLVAIKAAITHAASKVSPFILHVNGLDCFPTIHKPRVLWVGIEGEIAPLRQVHAELGLQLQAAIGGKPDSRPYTPHLTLGRVKRNIQAAQIKQLAQAIAAEKAKIGEVARFQVRDICLMRSQLQPSGPVYSVLQRAEIDG